MKSLGLSYALWFLFLFGASGLHRMYQGSWIIGILFFFTWGLFGLGTLYDMIFMSSIVRDANLRKIAQIKEFNEMCGCGL